mgnify:CR=1 FL=1
MAAIITANPFAINFLIPTFAAIIKQQQTMKKGVLVIMMMVLMAGFAKAQMEVDQAKAKFIYNFTKFFDWPQSERSGNFIIGVVGSDNVYDELTDITSGKRVVTQDITVKKFRSYDQIEKCHVLFVSTYKDDIISTAHKKTGHYTLIISDASNSLNKGAALNLFLDGERLKYKFEDSNALKMGLKFHSKIKEMASN